MNGYLQLAESPYNKLAEMTSQDLSKYVFIPEGYKGATKDLYIREDLLDTLPDFVYDQMMIELRPYQNTGLSGIFDKAKARRDARRANKEGKKGGSARRADRLKRIEARQAGKAGRAEKRSALLTNITDKVAGIFGGSKAPAGLDVSVGPGGVDVDLDTDPTFWDQYKVPIIVGGVAIGGFIAYKALTKKGR